MKVAPRNDASRVKVALSNRAVLVKVAPSKDASRVTVALSKDAVLVKVAPSKDAVLVKVAPSNRALLVKVAPSNRAVLVKVAPSKDAVLVKVAPSNRALLVKVAPSKDAWPIEQLVQSSCGSNALVRSICRELHGPTQRSRGKGIRCQRMMVRLYAEVSSPRGRRWSAMTRAMVWRARAHLEEFVGARRGVEAYRREHHHSSFSLARFREPRGILAQTSWTVAVIF